MDLRANKGLGCIDKVEQGLRETTDTQIMTQRMEERLATAQRVTREIAMHYPELFNEHDEDGICRHCQVPSDHPVFQCWKRSFSPGQVEKLLADRRKPHRIVDGVCRSCGHLAGKSWAQQMKDIDDPSRLRAEHSRGEHPGTMRAYCPECELVRKARRTEWQATHRAPGHDCPACEEDRRWAVTRGLEWEHFRGKHTNLVVECPPCDAKSELANELAADTRGEHGDFDYRDKNAVAPCSECREKQWGWYEHRPHPREDEGREFATKLSPEQD